MKTHKLIRNLLGWEVCVPIATPDDYFKQADKEYRRKSAMLADLGKRVHEQAEHDKRWPLGPEHYGDRYLVEELGYKL